MKKRSAITRKLTLNRETLTNLDPQRLSGVAGGRICITSGQGTSDPEPSVCICDDGPY